MIEVKYRMSFKWNTRNACNMKDMHICINIRRLFMTFSWFIINVCNIHVRVTQNLSLVMLPMLLVNKLLQKDPGIAYRNIMADFIFSFVWKNFFLSLSTSYFSNLNKKKKKKESSMSAECFLVKRRKIRLHEINETSLYSVYLYRSPTE